MSRSTSRFTVDTHLFRELGELLVGRDSTALVELVKNSYDADATEVIVHAENLSDLNRGFILVKDDGLGMTRTQFEEGFLRIASRAKEEGARVSPRFKRRYTGAKGIGRLAAHKLASFLEVESIAVHPEDGRFLGAFRAHIDWTLIEQATTLDKINPNAVKVTNFKPAPSSKGGTVLILRRLRRGWTEREVIRFVREAKSALPPDFLTKSVAGRLIERSLLFGDILQHSEPENKSEWELKLTGDFDVGDEFFESVAEAASWVLEVDATKNKISFGIAPTKRYARFLPEATSVVRTLEEETPSGYPKFQARVLIREGDWEQASDAAKRWRQSASGVMVYLEGFRVLPYGERGNDWLDMDKSYSQRKSDPLIAGLLDDSERRVKGGFSYLPTRAYLGGVFLTLVNAGELKMLVNREGFLPDEHFLHIQSVLTLAVSFATRVRSEAKALQKAEWRSVRASRGVSRSLSTPIQGLEEAAAGSLEIIGDIRAAVAMGKLDTAAAKIASAEKNLKNLSRSASEIRDQQSLVFTLASIGTQMAAFVHEIHGLLALAQAVERSLDTILDEGLPYESRDRIKLTRTLKAAQELRQALERQAAYLTDVTTADARRRRSRQNLSAAFDSAVNLLSHHAQRMRIKIINNIPEDLKSPAMFKAELVAIFTNLISNAIKAAGRGGRIKATGTLDEQEGTRVRVENTGVVVEPKNGEVWFRAFASSTGAVDPALGQGMGLGLTITRRMLDEHGAEIRFVRASRGFSTCLEIMFPK